MTARTGDALGNAAWLALMLLALAGCQAPSAHHASSDPDHPKLSRSCLLARQVLADSVVQMTYCPWQFGRNLVQEPLLHLRAAGTGVMCKRLLPAFWSDPKPCGSDRPTLDWHKLEEELHNVCRKPLKPACVTLHLDGGEALEVLRQHIDSATRSIDVLMFLWENDETGAAIAQWLAAKASPDLRVRVLIDGGGNLIFGKPADGPDADVNGVVCWLARQPYVEVLRTRNPFLKFDHRKLVLVDGCAAFTGGRNFTHQSFFGQHDLSVRLTGPLTQELQECYDRFWREQGGKANAEGARRKADGGEGPDAVLEAEPNAWARLVCTAPPTLHLANAMYRAVDRAQRHIYLENVYFADTCLTLKLILARRRGVDVRVVLSVESCSDVVNRANRVTANRLLKAGVRVYLYPGMVHAKAASVDGCWAYLGTGNYDALSLRHNREMGLAIGAGPLIDELEQRLFLNDFRDEWELRQPLPTCWKDYLAEIVANVAL